MEVPALLTISQKTFEAYVCNLLGTKFTKENDY